MLIICQTLQRKAKLKKTTFFFFFLSFFREKKIWNFMLILADDSREITSLIFSEK